MKINKITLTLLAAFIGFSSQGLASGKYDKDDDDEKSYYSDNSGKGKYDKDDDDKYDDDDDYESDDSYESDSEYTHWTNHYGSNSSDYYGSSGGDYGNSGGSDYPDSGGDDYSNSGGSDYPDSGGDDYGNSGGSDYPDSGGDDYSNSAGSDYPDSGGDDYGNSGGSGYPDSGGDDYGNSGGSDYPDSGGDDYGNSGGSDYHGSHGGGYGDDSGGDGYTDTEDTSKRLALRLVGSGEMYEDTVPDYDGDKYPDPAICFDVDLQDIATGEVIGSATDCLSEVTPVGEGLKLIGTTFFYLPDGMIVTRGITSVRPVSDEPGTSPSSIITPEGREITHITGASSDENAVLKSYGEYWWHQGTVRLSGMVDMSNFTGAVGDEIYFDCLFLLNLDKKKTKPHWWNWYRRHYYQDDRYDRKGDDSHGSYTHESYSSSSDGNYRYQSSTTYSSSSSKGY